MATTQNLYTGNGSTTSYSFTFEYIEPADIKVSLDGVDTTAYTLPNATTVQFTTAPANGVAIRIYRFSNRETLQATFYPGSSIRAEDLNDNFQQHLFIEQENFSEIPLAIDRAVIRFDQLDPADVITEAEQDAGPVLNDDSLFTSAASAERFDTKVGPEPASPHETGRTWFANDADGTLKVWNGSEFKRVGRDGAYKEVITETQQDTGTATSDDSTFTSAAAAKRSDVIYQATGVDPIAPTAPGTWQTGKLLYDASVGNEVLKIWNGTSWTNVAAGLPNLPATNSVIRYVDAANGTDATGVTGFFPNQPLQSIGRALDLVNAENADGTVIVVAAGVYQETLPLQIERANISIVGQALRSVFVQPTQATETNTMFECNTGTLLANMTFVGLKANGTRGGASYDSDSTYGLPENQGWACAFYNNAVIKKSPYIQNCTNFSDSSIDNSIKYDQTNLQSGALGGDTTSAMSGGGILCDGSVPASNSPLRSFVVDSFTQVCLDGPGILCTNGGYGQLVSFFGTFCHYHAKALNGGQLNLSNCTSDFGRYGLIADGRSSTAQITGSTVGSAAAGTNSVVVDGLTAQGGFFSNQPGSTMIMEVDGNDYQILDATQVSGNQCQINIYRATNTDPATNLGLVSTIGNNKSVAFKLRSYISTGGHTFEYVGAGTDYSAHPDYGGQAIEANQVVELGGTGSADDALYNCGKVWQSSTDENGLFKVGSKFKVDQRRGTITLDGFTVATELVTDISPQLGGDLDLNSSDIIGSGNINISGTVTATSFTGDGSSLTGVDVVDDTTPQLGGDLDVNGQKLVSVSNGNIVLEPNGTGNVTLTATSSLTLPVGTAAQRPGTAAKGMIRFNDDNDKFEGYDGANWGSLINGDIGTSPDQIPVNGFLGQMAFVDQIATVRPYYPYTTGGVNYYPAPANAGDIQFRYISDTQIKLVMRGTADDTKLYQCDLNFTQIP